MADLESRVEKLEDKVKQLEIDINASLGDIKTDLTEIKAYMKNDTNNGDLKNAMLKKDIDNNSERISKIEAIISKITWTIVLEVLGIISAAVIAYIKLK